MSRRADEGQPDLINGMVDSQRFLARAARYLGRMAGFMLICTVVHHRDRTMGLTVLWAISYVVGAFVLLILVSGIEVWGRQGD